MSSGNSKTSKFCAGRTTDSRQVESIDRHHENATTGTPAALSGKLAGDRIDGFEFWAVFALGVMVFGIAWLEEQFDG
jgi:hypothetical protein